jgi:hypothetical protein
MARLNQAFATLEAFLLHHCLSDDDGVLFPAKAWKVISRALELISTYKFLADYVHSQVTSTRTISPPMRHRCMRAWKGGFTYACKTTHNQRPLCVCVSLVTCGGVQNLSNKHSIHYLDCIYLCQNCPSAKRECRGDKASLILQVGDYSVTYKHCRRPDGPLVVWKSNFMQTSSL